MKIKLLRSIVLRPIGQSEASTFNKGDIVDVPFSDASELIAREIVTEVDENENIPEKKKEK
jgi:hypothetical protein